MVHSQERGKTKRPPARVSAMAAAARRRVRGAPSSAGCCRLPRRALQALRQGRFCNRGAPFGKTAPSSSSSSASSASKSCWCVPSWELNLLKNEHHNHHHIKHHHLDHHHHHLHHQHQSPGGVVTGAPGHLSQPRRTLRQDGAVIIIIIIILLNIISIKELLVCPILGTEPSKKTNTPDRFNTRLGPSGAAWGSLGPSGAVWGRLE